MSLNDIDYSDIANQVNDARLVMQDTMFDMYAGPQPITVYQISETEIVISDPNYDSSWASDKLPDIQSTYATNSTEITAIVAYERNNEKIQTLGDDSPHVRLDLIPQYITIKVRELSEIQLIASAKIIHFLDEKYKVESGIERVFFFGETYMFKTVLQQTD